MAGNTYIDIGTSGKMKGRIWWKSTSNGSAANSSQVEANIQVARTDAYGPTTGTFTGDIVVNGNTETFSTHASVNDSWVTVKTHTTMTVGHNADGTKTIYIGGTIHGPSGTSMAGATVSGGANCTLDTIPRYPSVTQSLNTRTLNSIKMNYSSDSTCDYLWYSTNNGSNWTGVDIADGTSGTYTITGLSPNTTYNIKTRLRRKDSQLTADSSALSVTTYQIGLISSVNNFNHGDSTTLVTTNPSGSALTLVMKIGNTQIKSQSVSTGSNTISFSDTELDNIYKLYGTGSSLTATFILTTAGSYTNSKTATITLKGNQKVIRQNVSGSWKRGKLWTNVSGTWKRAVIWTNVSGTWKRGI